MKNILEFLKESLVNESFNVDSYIKNSIKLAEDFGISAGNSNSCDNICNVIDKYANDNGYETVYISMDRNTDFTDVKDQLESINKNDKVLVVFKSTNVKSVKPETWNYLMPVFLKHTVENVKYKNMITCIVGDDCETLSGPIKSRLKIRKI